LKNSQFHGTVNIVIKENELNELNIKELFNVIKN